MMFTLRIIVYKSLILITTFNSSRLQESVQLNNNNNNDKPLQSFTSILWNNIPTEAKKKHYTWPF